MLYICRMTFDLLTDFTEVKDIPRGLPNYHTRGHMQISSRHAQCTHFGGVTSFLLYRVHHSPEHGELGKVKMTSLLLKWVNFGNFDQLPR